MDEHSGGICGSVISPQAPCLQSNFGALLPVLDSAMGVGEGVALTFMALEHTSSDRATRPQQWIGIGGAHFRASSGSHGYSSSTSESTPPPSPPPVRKRDKAACAPEMLSGPGRVSSPQVLKVEGRAGVVRTGGEGGAAHCAQRVHGEGGTRIARTLSVPEYVDRDASLASPSRREESKGGRNTQDAHLGKRQLKSPASAKFHTIYEDFVLHTQHNYSDHMRSPSNPELIFSRSDEGTKHIDEGMTQVAKVEVKDTGSESGDRGTTTSRVHEELELRILTERLRLLSSQRELAALHCQQFTHMLETALLQRGSGKRSGCATRAPASPAVAVPEVDEEQYWSSPNFYRGVYRAQAPRSPPKEFKGHPLGARMPLDTYFITNQRRRLRGATKAPNRHTRKSPRNSMDGIN